MSYAIKRNATGSWLAHDWVRDHSKDRFHQPQGPKWVSLSMHAAVFEDEADAAACVLEHDLEDTEGVLSALDPLRRRDGVTIVELPLHA